MKSKFLLKAFCAWTVFVWSVLIKNMITAEGHELSFRIVHICLALVSIAFAVAVWPLSNRISKDSELP